MIFLPFCLNFILLVIKVTKLSLPFQNVYYAIETAIKMKPLPTYIQFMIWTVKVEA